jgi:hypothetical protein
VDLRSVSLCKSSSSVLSFVPLRSLRRHRIQSPSAVREQFLKSVLQSFLGCFIHRPCQRVTSRAKDDLYHIGNREECWSASSASWQGSLGAYGTTHGLHRITATNNRGGYSSIRTIRVLCVVIVAGRRTTTTHTLLENQCLRLSS